MENEKVLSNLELLNVIGGSNFIEKPSIQNRPITLMKYAMPPHFLENTPKPVYAVPPSEM